MTPTELRAALVALVRASGALPTSGRIEAESVAFPQSPTAPVAMVQVLSDVRRGRGSPVEAWTVAADGSQALAHYVYRRAMVAVLFVGRGAEDAAAALADWLPGGGADWTRGRNLAVREVRVDGFTESAGRSREERYRVRLEVRYTRSRSRAVDPAALARVIVTANDDPENPRTVDVDGGA